MPTRKIVTPPAAIDFDSIRDELGIPASYPAPAVAEAAEVAHDSLNIGAGGIREAEDAQEFSTFADQHG